MGLIPRNPKNRKSRCVYMLCECERKPRAVRELIHERDEWFAQRTQRGRYEAEILDIKINFIVGELPSLQTAEQLEARLDREIPYWESKL